MKINRITLADYKSYNFKRNEKTNTTTPNVESPIGVAYADFAINFRGRTPENFYAQEFNIKSMPQTMKTYLNEDYESRKHIPPEQVMNQSFKYLELADKVSDVKNFYPEESLFDGLHEVSKNSRTGILAEIKLAKEMSGTPLFKDGSDNLGTYLLKKIYLEGKTIKEINKDFYEKDLNAEFKGVVAEPISYTTTSAYGIKYPKTDFWHSFIATRDEYKKFFVTLPKQDKADLQRELAEKKAPQKAGDIVKKPKAYVRKYSIKSFQKEHLKNDIKNSKGDIEGIEKSIRKRFGANDPEANFIVKYLSPIMTISADRIHLSEEQKAFAESEKASGRKVENLFAQFWKAKPDLLEQYSTAITDTMELFEETYGEGGTLPINNEFQVITDKVTNQKPIDFVPQRFVELLDYTQTIVPTRMGMYAKHDELQKEWEDHIKWRYGEVEDIENTKAKIEEVTASNVEDMVNQAAKQENANIWHLRGTNGEDIQILVSSDTKEAYAEYTSKRFSGYPDNYVRQYLKEAYNNPILADDYAMLSFMTENISDQLDDKRLLSASERKSVQEAIDLKMADKSFYATVAMLEAYGSKIKNPEILYKQLFGYNPEGGTVLDSLIMSYKYDKSMRAELNNLYNSYQKPLTTSEILKATNILVDFIRNFDMRKSIFAGLTNESFDKFFDIVNVLRDKSGTGEWKKSFMHKFLAKSGVARSLLQKSANPEHARTKQELVFYNVCAHIKK